MRCSGNRVLRTAAIAACVLLVGCHSIGGTVSGLSASSSGLVLEDNGTDILTVSGNGAFTFNQPLSSGSSYSVTIATQPAGGALCWVANGSGTVNGSDITNVAVNCGRRSKVVVVGGDGGPLLCGPTVNTADIYDSYSNSFFLDPGRMPDARRQFASVEMLDGSVLVAGGVNDDCNHPPFSIASAVIYRYGSGFTATGPMNSVRSDASAALLPNGDVLVAGGFVITGLNMFSPLNTAEIYHSASNSFTLLPNLMSNPRFEATATALPGGQVLIAGGVQGDLLATADLFDAGTQTFRPLTMTSPHRLHTATLLKDGTVLLAGGMTPSGPMAAAEIYDPTSQTFTAVSPMGTNHAGHTATLLDDGRVLIAGGFKPTSASIAATEIYDPVSRSFTPGPSMLTARQFHTATLLNDGRVLIAGGLTIVQSTELFDGQSFSAGPPMSVPRGNDAAFNVPFEVIVGEQMLRPRAASAALPH